MSLQRAISTAHTVTGTFLLTWSGLLTLYFYILADAPSGCDNGQLLVNAVCRTTWYYLIAPAFIGFLLMIIGIVTRPAPRTQREYLATGPFAMSFFFNTLLIALVTGIWAMLITLVDSIEGSTWTINDVGYAQETFLTIAAIVAAVLFLVGLTFHVANTIRQQQVFAVVSRRRRVV